MKKLVTLVGFLVVISNMAGCMGEEDENEPPTCDLSVSHILIYIPENTTFDLSATDTDGTIASWELDVDSDGTAEYSGSGNPPATQHHAYENAGRYNATLMVTDDDDGNATATVADIVVLEKPLPDLAIESIIIWPWSPQIYTKFGAGVYIKNIGFAESQECELNVKIIHVNSGIIYFQDSQTINAILPEGIGGWSDEYTLMHPGDYQVRAEIITTFNEYNMSNNVMIQQFTVT